MTTLVRRFAAAILVAVVPIVFFARSAAALGTVTVSPKTVQEVDGKWKVNMQMNYGSAPHLAHIPMIFEFTQTVHWERALTDKSPDKPIVVKTPLQNQQPINESMDVGFSDPMGKIFPVTKFDFLIRRDRGFEAGEYSLKIKRESDGVQIGQVQKLTLEGDNPIVDRRAIVFSGEKSKKGGGDSADKGASGGSGDADKDKDKKAGGDAASGDTPPSEPKAGDAQGNEPPPVPPKQGGCGCRVGSADDAPYSAALALSAFALAALRRRRRSAHLR